MTNFPLFPESASTLAGKVDGIYFLTLGVAVVFSILIGVLVVFLAIRYKRQRVDQVGSPEHAPAWLEIVWSIIPFFILMGMFGWGAVVYFDTYRVPPDAERYYVVGKQWMWKYQHPQGNREINDLHVPVGRPIELVITSEDVIHSFYVPAFRIKRDAVPGRYNTAWFEATKVGSYNIFCAEYCGTEHSLMIGKIHVMEPNDYEEWLRGTEPERTLAATGEELFTAMQCHTCHRQDSDARAPILHGVFGEQQALAGGGTVTVDDEYVRESIMAPQAKVAAGYQPIMPTYRGRLSEEQVLDLISYIRSLSSTESTGGEPAAEGE